MSALEIGRREPGTQRTTLRETAGAVMIAVAIGSAAVLDSIVAFHRPTYPHFPFAWTLALLTAGTSFWLLARWRNEIFQRRYEFAIAVLLAAGACAGLGLGRLDPTDVAILGVAMLWLFAAVVEQMPIRVPLVVVVLALLLFACSVLSVSNGGVGSIIAQRTLVNKLVLLVMLSTFCASGDRWKFAERVLLAVALISAVVALVSGVLHLATGVALTAEDLPQYRYKLTPLGRMLRVTAFSATTQTLAHLLLLGTAMAMCVPMRTWRRVATIAVLGAALGWTFSTGGYVAFVIVVGLGMLVRRPERSLHYLTVLAAVGCAAYLLGVFDLLYDNVLLPLGGKGVQDRIGYLRAGFEAIGRHPFTGLGLRMIGRVLKIPVHNAYVQFAAEIGIAGGVAFTSMVVYLTARCAWIVGGMRRSDSQAWMKAILLGMIALGTHLISEPFYDNYMTWAFMGIAAGAVAGHDRATPGLPRLDEVESEP